MSQANDSAAKTALLLDNTKLGANQVKVVLLPGGPESAETHESTDHPDHLAQEDKPRTAIFAEYLSHGYVIGDQTLHKAIEIDNTHGFSTKFMNFLAGVDSKYKVTDKSKAVDSQYGVTDKANAGWNTLNQYFEKAIGTPTGQKVRSFYTQGQKPVSYTHLTLPTIYSV